MYVCVCVYVCFHMKEKLCVRVKKRLCAMETERDCMFERVRVCACVEERTRLRACKYIKGLVCVRSKMWKLWKLNFSVRCVLVHVVCARACARVCVCACACATGVCGFQGLVISSKGSTGRAGMCRMCDTSSYTHRDIREFLPTFQQVHAHACSCRTCTNKNMNT